MKAILRWCQKRSFIGGGFTVGGFTGNGDPAMAVRYEPMRRGEVLTCAKCGRTLNR